MSALQVTGWGRTNRTVAARTISPTLGEHVADALVSAGRRGVIARGLGRSYGDVAQNGGGLVLDMTGVNRNVRIDEGGLVTVDAGVSLARLAHAALERGWFLPVTPGTRWVTVGGAVAADVHGKNHHQDGSIGDHLHSVELLLPNGDVRTLTPESDPLAFEATVGGFGLTGVILAARIQLLRVRSRLMSIDIERTTDLDETLTLLGATDHRYRYSVAWLDCAAPGRSRGRSVVIRGDHAEGGEGSRPRRSIALPPRLVVPKLASGGRFIGSSSIRAFNELYYRRARIGRGQLQALDSFFYPLDAVGEWNRLYGRHGFLQYQFVVPFGAEPTIRRILKRLDCIRATSTLAVLKQFRNSSRLLSFPREGWTLALDFHATNRDLGGALDDVDSYVAEAGGGVYLAKDARMRRGLLEAMYPRLDEWREAQAKLDPGGVMQSDLDRRLALAARAKR